MKSVNRRISWAHVRSHGSFNLEFAIAILEFILFIGSVEMSPSLFTHPRQIGTNASATAVVEDPRFCYTQGCFKTSVLLQKNMDPNSDPCNNFYKYACGNFINKTVIPEAEEGVNTLSLLQLEVYNKLHRNLLAHGNDDKKIYRLVKTLYKSCMDTDKIEKIGIRDVTLKMKSMGGWPVLEGDSWDEDGFDWQEATMKARKFGYVTNFFFSFGVDTDSRNSSKHIIFVDQPAVSLPREYLVKDDWYKRVEAYLNYAINMAEVFGANRTYARHEMWQVMDLEMRLSMITTSAENRRNAEALYNPMTILQLNEKFSNISWIEYINNHLPNSLSVTEEEIVNVANPRFFSYLQILLKNVTKRTIANFFMWKIAQSSASYLNNAVRTHEFTYKQQISGQIKQRERWMECVINTADFLPIAIGAVYVRENFDNESKEKVLEMIKYLKNNLTYTLERSEWMDAETRYNALTKLKAISNQIGYPPELLDDNILDEYYKDLELPANYYFENIQNIRKFNVDTDNAKLRKLVIKGDWKEFSDVSLVNAFYYLSQNTIFFPAAVLQGIIFDKDRMNYLNYGALGYAIGHEITHGFDDQGLQYDKDGNVFNWWTNSTKTRFNKRAECIIDQYSNFTIEEIGVKVNGKSTQGENIADIGGIKLAYHAYNQWLKEHSEEKKLLGINMSQKQLFWLSAANLWCGKYRPGFLKELATLDSHTPDEFRIIGTFMNLPEFAEDFSCPLGSRMNPVKKCTVW